MKHVSFFVVILFIFFVACKKGDTGPAGPAGVAGPTGPQGPQGIAGNANALQYTFGTQPLDVSFSTLSITTTIDTMNRSAWFVYLYNQPIARWYSLPGGGIGGATQYRVSMSYATTKVNLYIDKTGPGEVYANAKVVRIYTSGQLNGGRLANPVDNLPNIDFTDYKVVKEYYRLPD